MKDNGKMIFKMDMVLKYGSMVLSMKAIIIKVRKTDKGLMFGLINLNILDNGLIIKYTDMVFILGKMEGNMRYLFLFWLSKLKYIILGQLAE